MRVNGNKVSKPATPIGAGDVLTFPQAKQIRIVRLIALAKRRGPASEAQALYEDMSPPKEDVPQNPAFEGKGRPTKKERRQADPFRRSMLD